MNAKRKAWSALAVIGFLAVAFAHEVERLDYPEDIPGPPYYSRHQVVGDDWVAIPWLRDPACVDKKSNLLDFDFGSQSCTLVVTGYVIRSSPTGAPDVNHADGNEDMPVWFVSRDDWDDMVDDGDLTIKELNRADSLLIGEADQFVLHLENPDAQLLKQSGHGELEDGRSFSFEYSRVAGDEKKSEVTID